MKKILAKENEKNTPGNDFFGHRVFQIVSVSLG